MNIVAKPKFTVDEYLAWAEGRTGRYELYRGEIYCMAPERAQHAERKFSVQTTLLAAIRAAKVPCRMLPDGMTVRIDAATAFEPDAVVYCGPKLAPHALEVTEPVIVVEVLSPSTRSVDTSLKLAGYFAVPSIRHYLVFEPDVAKVIHYRRGDDGSTAIHIVLDGEIRLDPPGIFLSVDDLYSDPS